MECTKPIPYIEFANVSVHYSEEVTALKNVSLSIGKGEFVFLLGPTGAGKSTLLKLLTRDVLQSSGKVLFDGQELGRVSDYNVPALRRKMGIVPQDFALLDRKKVWENVAYALRAVGFSKREARNQCPVILEHARMGLRLDAFPNQLSGGEQQRVAIARALIHRPKLLLADEPTGNLDQVHSMEIMDLLLQLNAEGATIVVATHDMLVVEQMREVARIVMLDGGMIASDERPAPKLIDTQLTFPVHDEAGEAQGEAEPIATPEELNA